MVANDNLPPLYDYQLRSFDELRDGIRRGIKGQVLSIPTGGGKTVVAQHMIQSAIEKGAEPIFVVDRIGLAEQTSRRFNEAGIDHGVIGAGRDYGRGRQVRIYSAQTLARRGWPRCDLAIVDECHIQYKFLTETLPERRHPYIGLSATPMAQGMGKIYGGIVNVTTTNKLIEDGKLVTPIFRPSVEIDMTGAPRMSTGEWSPQTVEDRSRPIIGDIVSTWVQETATHFGGIAKTMAFAASIAHGEEICEQFQKAGYDFRQVSAYDDPDDRDETMKAFRHGEFPGIVSVDVLGRGIDIPDVLCVILARPFRRGLMAFLQQVGRGLRTAVGKDRCLYLDHAGNSIGFYDEMVDFFAHGVTKLDQGKFRSVVRNEKKREDVLCVCGVVLPPAVRVCPSCGRERKRRNDVTAVAGKTITIDPVNGSARATGWQGPPLKLWEACCTHSARFLARHGDQERALRQARNIYKDLSGDWPPRHYLFAPGRYVPKGIQRQISQQYAEWKRSQRESAA